MTTIEDKYVRSAPCFPLPAVLGLMLIALLPITQARAERAAFPLDCAYAPRGGELGPQGRCAGIDGGPLRIDPTHLARVAFDRGLAEFRIETMGIAYARRDGRAIPVFILDNGGDAFAEGRVRGLRDGHLVYYDRQLRPRIVTAFDWGEPFRDGRAVVCVGCTSQAADAEHSFMTGGRWGVIDRRGRLVAPLAPR